jgi:hypothetical protein
MKSISMTGIRKFITAAALLACSFQCAGAADPPSSSGPLHSELGRPESAAVGSGEDATPADLDRFEAVLKEHEFVRRFNNLFSALLNFASTYNTGHVIDAKRAKSVRKALRELEKSEWFNPRKAE